MYTYLKVKQKKSLNYSVMGSNNKSKLEAIMNAEESDAIIVSTDLRYFKKKLERDKVYYAVIAKVNYRYNYVLAVFESPTEAKFFAKRCKRSLYPREFAYSVVKLTNNIYDDKEETKSMKKEIVEEEHNYTIDCKGGCGEYYIRDNGKIIGSADNRAEAEEELRALEEALNNKK